MTQVLDRQKTEYRVPVRRRRHVLDTTLITIGALAALVGVYFQFAPSSWWLAHFSEAYYLWSYIVGGLTAAVGFGVYANRSMEDGVVSTRTVVGYFLAIAAVIGAMVAVLAL